MPVPQTFPPDLKQIDHDRVLAAADKYLSEKPVTITAFHAPRSAGGAHDYFSEADYFWPDPAHPDGPFIRRDGMSNPGNFSEHRHALIHMSIMVPALAAAFEITAEQKYADQAIAHLVAWFVDDSTRMEPRLPYSQAIHGVCTGRSIGLIDTVHLVEVTRAIGVLRAKKQLRDPNDAGIQQWFKEYLKWFTTHEYGITEGKTLNNHATCYWLQVASFAQLVDDAAQLAECRRRFKEQLILQMNASGAFPDEQARTKPYAYSLFNLDQMVTICKVLATKEEDLWNYVAPTRQTLKKAVEYMFPYVKDKSTWPFKPDVMYDKLWPVRSPAWLFAGLAYHEPKYIELWETLDADPTEMEVLRNLPVRQPVIWVD